MTERVTDDGAPVLDAPAAAPDSPLGPGERLGQARVAAGLSLDEVARSLRFASRQIAALERGDYAALPGVAVARGMVRSYARLLKLDPAPLLQSLAGRVEVPDADRLAVRYNEPVPFSNPGKRSNTVYAVLSVLVLAAAAAVWYEWRHDAPGEARMTFVPAAQAPLEPPTTTVASATAAPPIDRSADKPVTVDATPAEKSSGVAGEAGAAARPAPDAPSGPNSEPPAEPVRKDPAPAASAQKGAMPAAGSESAAAQKPATLAVAPSTASGPPPAEKPAATGRIEFRFARDSWVEVRDGSDKVVFSRLNPAGSEATVQGEPPFSLVIGNAQFVEVTYKGRRIDLVPHTRVAVGRLTLE